MSLYAVIMAGGIGSRFWPRSRERRPKQLLQLFGDKTMIQGTVDRVSGFIPPENIFIVTNKLHESEIQAQLPGIPSRNIISEPFGRNTAPCIGVAAAVIKSLDPAAVIVVLPADHIIPEKDLFAKTILSAAAFAEQHDGLITLGIQPTRPETGYGYIQVSGDQVSDNVFSVFSFAEKPNYATAQRFLESGDFLWNSGMFVWRVDVILSEIEKYLPDLFVSLRKLEPHIFKDSFNEALLKMYGEVSNISIDYGVMEHSKHVFLSKADFTWNDVGSWEEVYRLTPKNENGIAAVGEIYSDVSNDCYVFSPHAFTALIGVENLAIINTPDALLICRRDMAQNVKKVVDHLKMNKLENHL